MTTRCRPHRSNPPAPDLDQVQLTCLLEAILSNWLPLLGPVPAELAGLAGAGHRPARARRPAHGRRRGGWRRQHPRAGPAPLSGPDPVLDLFGFVAPPSWSAFGVVASGAHAGAGPGPDPIRAPTRGAGRAAGLAPGRDRPALTWATRAARRHLGRRRPVGRIPDACRRSLGLATDAPQAPVIELWATLWLERVLAEVLADPGHGPGPSWPGPSPPSASCPGRGRRSTSVESVVAAGQAAQVWSWGDLRRLHAGGDAWPASG